MADRSGMLHEKIKDNVSLVNNAAVEQDGVQLIFSTLWSQISPAFAFQISQGMSDFHVIKYKGKPFSVEQFNRQHEESVSFIQKALQQKYAATTVVVSHHIPTFQHYPQQYKGSVLSEAFATELYDLIEAASPDYWIYGHHHSNVPDFTIGNTQLLTNQLGYVKCGEHAGFDRGKCLFRRGGH